MNIIKVYRIEHESTFSGPYYQEETHPNNKDIEGTNYLWWWEHDHTISFNTEPIQLYPGCIEGLSKRKIEHLVFGFLYKVFVFEWFTENELLTLLSRNYVVATYVVNKKNVHTFKGTTQVCFTRTKQTFKTRKVLSFDEIFDEVYDVFLKRKAV